MKSSHKNQRFILEGIARRTMLEHGLLPDFSAAVVAELGRLQEPALAAEPAANPSQEMHDMRDLLWASIDNDDSLDLDQLTVAEELPGGSVRVLVAVADVASLVKLGKAIDEHARHNTTSVYTAARVFPMLPNELSTDLTSLNFGEERPSIVVDMQIDEDGQLSDSDIYQARVTNHAKLAYSSVAAWLDAKGKAPEAITAVKDLA